ncbi:response regulator [Pleomorphomonas oryzae]|uniref:response regulator n=1 Tax=Pleomorphomonas oryzae TaxID=261934 RepID=UPI0004067212|nr:response regulator [Pleomorphomonas oryzae]
MSASILIVEDEWLIAEDYASTLHQAGYRIVGPYPSVEEGIAAVDAEPVDAALLDIQLQDEMSFPVAERLQERNIPFAFLSGYSRQHLPPKLASCELVPKPVAQRTLLATVKKICSKGT